MSAPVNVRRRSQLTAAAPLALAAVLPMPPPIYFHFERKTQESADHYDQPEHANIDRHGGDDSGATGWMAGTEDVKRGATELPARSVWLEILK